MVLHHACVEYTLQGGIFEPVAGTWRVRVGAQAPGACLAGPSVLGMQLFRHRAWAIALIGFLCQSVPIDGRLAPARRCTLHGAWQLWLLSAGVQACT